MFPVNLSRHDSVISRKTNIKANDFNPLTTVNELNAYHSPTLSELNDVKNIIKDYSNSNKEERKQLSTKIDEIFNKLCETRKMTYQFFDEGTDYVRGEFKPGKTIIDRDDYIRMLVAFNRLKEGIEKAREDKGFAKCEVDKKLHLHHSSSIYGDLKSLNELLNKNGETGYSPTRLPNLTYNKGGTQFG